jgi:hypothetical protein
MKGWWNDSSGRVPASASTMPGVQTPGTKKKVRHQWLTLIILAEIRRIGVRSLPRQIVHKTLSRKNPSQKR